MKNRKGFTITELVIVIAVIAILAAVLIPTFSSIIKKADKSAALQEAKNLNTEYIASVDYAVATPEEDYYIKTSKDIWFQVENGQLKTDALANAPTSGIYLQANDDASAEYAFEAVCFDEDCNAEADCTWCGKAKAAG